MAKSKKGQGNMLYQAFRGKSVMPLWVVGVITTTLFVWLLSDLLFG